MNSARRKQLQLSRILVFLCTLYQLTISVRLYEPLSLPQVGEDSTEGVEETTEESTGQTTADMHVVQQVDASDFKAFNPSESLALPNTNPTIQCTSVAPESVTTIMPASPGEVPHIRSKYPADLFSIEDRRRGWVILHIIGMIYMFISLVIVCDEFFVPALGVITDKLAISDDVAGATFMAAGCSAPKLFAAVLRVFIPHGNMGFGLPVGSAVFNILFVIGMCALFSREVLHLTWWPLFRDVSFYIFGLILLIMFFLDNVIMWWESMMLVTSYALYVIFMKFNVQIERAFKTQLHKYKHIVNIDAVEESEKECVPAGEDGSQGDEDAIRDEDDIDRDYLKIEEKEDQKRDKPLSLNWPDTRCKQATYLLLLPIIFPLWLTVPDVRKQKSRKLFVVTFLGSIVWIAVFSYFMVWWACQVGETIGVSDQIITILAAEMSIPDLIPSVIVARKGLGDMAVSSSMGRNIFCVTVCLPVPLLLYSSFHGLAPVPVSSNGVLCAIVLLFLSFLSVITSIASCKWRTSKVLGLTMSLLYFIFLVVRLMFHYRVILCPV